MAGSRTLKLNILAETKGLTDGLNKANNQVSGASNGLSKSFDKVKLAAIAATAAGAAFAVKYGRDAIIAASDLSETIAKAGEIFGDSAKQIEAFASTAAASLGQSKQQAIDAATTFAVFGKSAGLAGTDLVKFSTDFTVLASDLASFNNTSPDEAITAIGAALRGEAEPLRRFGVLLDDATLRSAALELGIVSTTKNALTPQQKVLAAQEVIFRQTADAQGDFARTSDGLANSQRILAAQLDNVKITIGTALLPIATELFASFSKRLIPAVENFANTFRDDLVPYIEREVLPAFADLKDSIFGIFDALQLTNDELEESSVLTTAFKMTVRDFVPETVKGFADVGKAVATLFDVLRRGIAFLQGDFDTAFREFENRFKETNEQINKVDRSTVNAYKQFQFFNRVTKDETIPAITNLNTANTNLAASTNKVTASKDKATESTKKLTTAKEALNKKTKEATVDNDKLNKSLKESNRIAEDVPTSGTDGKTGSSVGAGGMNPLIGQLIGLKGRGGTIQDLVNQFTGTGLGMNIPTSNLIRNASDQLLTDMYEVILAQVSYQELIDKGLGNLNLNILDTLLTLDDPGFRVLPGTRIGQSSLTVDQLVALAKPVTINVNGTFMDPEGAARAVQEVIQDSNARSGFQSLVPALGIE